VSQTLTIRNFRWDDLPGVLAVINGAAESFNDLRRYTLDELRFDLEDPLEQPEQNYFVAVASDGQIVGMCECYYEAEVHIGWSNCYVLPSQRGRGIGTRLFELSEMRLMALLPAESDDTLVFQRVIDSADAAGIDLIARAGYTHTRAFYTMMIDLTDAHLDAPTTHDGMTIQGYDPAHLRDFYDVHQDTFEDHWGSHREPYDEWTREFTERTGVDPAATWRMARDGDQIAGVAISRAFGGWDGMGWLSVLGVRRAWRRRGLGDALLRATFAAFRARGFTRVGLGVDASSLTNAVALYERAGMRVYHRRDVYRRVVRETSNPTHAKQTLT